MADTRSWMTMIIIYSADWQRKRDSCCNICKSFLFIRFHLIFFFLVPYAHRTQNIIMFSYFVFQAIQILHQSILYWPYFYWYFVPMRNVYQPNNIRIKKQDVKGMANKKSGKIATEATFSIGIIIFWKNLFARHSIYWLLCTFQLPCCILNSNCSPSINRRTKQNCMIQASPWPLVAHSSIGRTHDMTSFNQS